MARSSCNCKCDLCVLQKVPTTTRGRPGTPCWYSKAHTLTHTHTYTHVVDIRMCICMHICSPIFGNVFHPCAATLLFVSEPGAFSRKQSSSPERRCAVLFSFSKYSMKLVAGTPEDLSRLSVRVATIGSVTGLDFCPRRLRCWTKLCFTWTAHVVSVLIFRIRLK